MFEGWVSPFAEAQRQAEDRNAAWNALQADPGAAALFAGLSMLANNNGRRSFGQLAGMAGADALAGTAELAAARRAQARYNAYLPVRAAAMRKRRQPAAGYTAVHSRPALATMNNPGNPEQNAGPAFRQYAQAPDGSVWPENSALPTSDADSLPQQKRPGSLC